MYVHYRTTYVYKVAGNPLAAPVGDTYVLHTYSQCPYVAGQASRGTGQCMSMVLAKHTGLGHHSQLVALPVYQSVELASWCGTAVGVRR